MNKKRRFQGLAHVFFLASILSFRNFEWNFEFLFEVLLFFWSPMVGIHWLTVQYVP